MKYQDVIVIVQGLLRHSFGGEGVVKIDTVDIFNSGNGRETIRLRWQH